MMRTRPCTRQDRSAWLQMRDALWPGESAEHAAEIDAYFEGRAIDIQHVLLATTDADEPVGFIELNVRPYAEGCEHSPVPYVEGWFVAAPYRRQGVGRLLIESAERWACDHGFSELASDTETHNAASIAAHAALGFDEAERIVCFIKKLV